MRQRVLFSGRVQGVGFRATARAIAHAHPVSGFVRNEPDGTVLLEVQGPPDAVAGFLLDLSRRFGRNITHTDSGVVADRADERDFTIAP
jgi:acylphosphatase